MEYSMCSDRGIITTSSLSSSSSRSASPSSSSSPSTNYPPSPPPPPPAAVTSPPESSSSSSSPDSPPPDLPPAAVTSLPSPPATSPVAEVLVISSCAACKYLGWSCEENCVLATCFPPTDLLQFIAVHRVFGATNIIKLLQFANIMTTEEEIIKFTLPESRDYNVEFLKLEHVGSSTNLTFLTNEIRVLRRELAKELPEYHRGDAVSSLVYEANARMKDPIYGCVGAISCLQQQISVLQMQLAIAQAEIVHMKMEKFSSMSDGGTPENYSSPSYFS